MASVLPLGINYSWGNLTFIWYGFPLMGITGIDVKQKQNKENSYGIGNEPIGRGQGRIEYECSLKGVYLDELAPLRKQAPNNKMINIAPSDVTVLMTSQNGTPLKLTLKYFAFLEDPFSIAEGDTKVVNDVPCIIAGYEWS